MLEDRVKATDVDRFDNRRRALDGNSAIGKNFSNQKRSFFKGQFAFHIIVGDIETVARAIGMVEACEIFAFVVG